MASKDYDDLLESFMNNSQRVYNDDKDSLERNGGRLPSAYNITSTAKKNSQKNTRAKRAEETEKKPKKQPKPVKEKGPVARFFGFIGKLILGVIMTAGVVGIVCVSVIMIYGYNFVNGDKVFDLDKEKYSQNQTSFIYGYTDDSHKKVREITRLHGEENRIWVDLDDMSPYLAKAFIAIEDERFEQHQGVDWKRIGGIIVKPSQIGQGGSTITQQLIKNLTDDKDVTFVRKFNEMLSALNLEKHYTKDQIIEAYLNTIYLSHGCYGVKTAAETYFGKDPKDLNAAECACLAGITKAPTRYDPFLNPEQLIPDSNGNPSENSRRKWILHKMLETGQITQAEYDEAVAYKMVYTYSKDYKPSKKNKTKKQTNKVINSYYTDYVIEMVLKDLQKMGYSAKKARNMLYGGGLKIYTAIDFDIQKQMEDIYENYKNMPDHNVQGASVVMDYHGRVLGIVGGTGKKKGDRELNRAWMSKRQPGSTMKPVAVYAPALQKSLDQEDVQIYWSTVVKDAPLTTIKGKPWPTNYGGGYSNKNVTIQHALSQSLNTVSARTLDMIGTTYSYDFLINRFHISTLDLRDDDYAPLATGSLTNGVSVLEMTAAYQAFGNGGYYYEPYGYYKIEDSQGNIIIEKDPEKTKEVAISANTAGVMNKLLQTVMTQGTGRRFQLYGTETFAKTGTTTDDKDRWFIGGTPEYICGVWYGYDLNEVIRYYLSSNPAGTLWNSVLNGVYTKKPKTVTKFEVPEGVVYREYSPVNGMLCHGSHQYGWFDENNLPGFTTYVAPTTTTEKEEEGDGEDEKKTTKKPDEEEPTSETESTTKASQEPPEDGGDNGNSADNGD